MTTMITQNKPTDDEWRKKYQAHMKSSRWKNTRLALFKLRGKKCEACGSNHPSLEVHHITYERLGHERLADLKIVCKACHEEEDRKREAAVRRKKEEARIDRVFATWFEKRTGRSAFYARPSDYGDFASWLEMKRNERF